MISPVQLTPGMNQNISSSIINNNFRQVEADNVTRIVKDESGIPRILIGKRPDGTYGIDYSLEGNDVLTAPPDGLGMSSSFNMYKIIASGKFDPQVRDASFTLNTTNVAYYGNHLVDITDIANNYYLNENVLVNVTIAAKNTTHPETGEMLYYDRYMLKDSGLWYHDGTNVLWFNYNYRILTLGGGSTEAKIYLDIALRLRCTNGSMFFVVPPGYGTTIWWEICNPTFGDTYGGKGGGDPLDGKYIYYDRTTYDMDGTILKPLWSTTYESTGGFYAGLPANWLTLSPPPA